MKSFALSVGSILTITAMLSPYIVLAADATLTDCTESELDRTGGHTNTVCSGGSLTLDTGQTSGTYETAVLDAGSPTDWTNIAWTPSEPYGKSLIGSDESAYGTNNMDTSANAAMLLTLNEASGTFTDLSGNGNNGTVSDATHGATGRIGNAVEFDGTNDFISIADDDTLDLTTDITIAAWIYADTFSDASNAKSILSKRNNASANPVAYELSVNSLTSELRFLSKTSGGATLVDADSTGTVSTGQWHHVAVTYNSSTVQFYIDGQAAGSASDTSSLDSNAYGIKIGTTGNGIWDWDGRIDEVGVWNTALDATDIATLYERGVKRLFIDFKTCDDAACSGETYTTTVSEIDNGTVSLPSISVSETENQYAQAQIRLEADDSADQPVLQDVTFTYTAAATPEFGPLLAATLILGIGWQLRKRSLSLAKPENA